MEIFKSMPKKYWLMKSEPESFSIHDLANAPKQTMVWDGVRNYQARNFMREMKVGELAFFYHSNANPPAIAGIMEIVRAAYPDHTAFDPDDHHFDSKSLPANPRWDMVDVKFVSAFETPLSLNELRENSTLQAMELLRVGSRLSVQPVRDKEWKTIIKLNEKRKPKK